MIEKSLKYDDKFIKSVLETIKNKNYNEFRFIARYDDRKKDPYNYMVELGITFNEAIEIIKGLTIDDFVEIVPDVKKSYRFLYVFKKQIKTTNGYIKIGFRYNDLTDKVVIVSFHPSISVC